MKSKNLSDSILKTVKSNGFKYIELPSVIEAISYKDLVKVFENLFSHLLTKEEMNFV